MTSKNFDPSKLKVELITSENNHLETDVEEFLSHIESHERDEHILENMVSDCDWSLRSYLKRKSRFTSPKGGITCVFYANEMIAISAMEFNDEVFEKAVLIGIRTWIKKEYRGSFIHFLSFIPFQESWAKERGAQKVFMTFNEDSRKSLYRHIAFRDKKKSDWGDRWAGYKSFGLVEFNHTPQYIIYKDI